MKSDTLAIIESIDEKLHEIRAKLTELEFELRVQPHALPILDSFDKDLIRMMNDFQRRFVGAYAKGLIY